LYKKRPSTSEWGCRDFYR